MRSIVSVYGAALQYYKEFLLNLCPAPFVRLGHWLVAVFEHLDFFFPAHSTAHIHVQGKLLKFVAGLGPGLLPA